MVAHNSTFCIAWLLLAATGTLTKIPAKVCPINWRKDTRHVKGLIRCAARHFGVSVDKAESIAFRESRFHPRAAMVVELPDGTLARTGTREGDLLELASVDPGDRIAANAPAELCSRE